MIEQAKPLKDIPQNKLVVIYGKSSTGKTTLAATFPKPLLYVRIKDDGVNSISNVEGVDIIEADTVNDIFLVSQEIIKATKYQTVLFDTFSFITEMWKEEQLSIKGSAKGNKLSVDRMSQPMWGDLQTVTNATINNLAKASKDKWVIVTGHQVVEVLEGLEDELTPDGRIAINKASRNHLEGLANIGLHTTRVKKETMAADGSTATKVKYAVDIGPNVTYWTKVQTTKDIKIPKRIINPTFDKIMEVINGTRK